MMTLCSPFYLQGVTAQITCISSRKYRFWPLDEIYPCICVYIQEIRMPGHVSEHHRDRLVLSVELLLFRSVHLAWWDVEPNVESRALIFFISSTFELHKPYLHLLELSSGASSLKKQGYLHRWLKTSDIKLLQTHFDIFSTFEFISRLMNDIFKGLVRGHPFWRDSFTVD